MVALVILGACGHRSGPHEPANSHGLSVDAATLRKYEPGLTDFCINDFLAGHTDHVPDENCFKFGNAERMHGTWAAAFEGSQFCPVSKYCDPKKTTDTWLEFAEPLKIDFAKYEGRYWAIEFIGRRTIYPGHYGHTGAWPNEVIVDRLISIKQVEAPTKG